MRKFQFARRLVVLFALVGAVLFTSAATAQDDEGAEKRVRVFVSSSGNHQLGEHTCEGDDCGEHNVRVWVNDDGQKVKTSKVFVVRGGDGEELHGEEHGANFVVERLGAGQGGRHVWFSADGEDGGFFSGGGYLGVQLTELSNALRSHFGVRDDAGVMISEVVEGSPAELAGFRAGDIITAVDGSEVGGAAGLSRRVRKLEEGESAGFEVMRDGQQMTINATIAKREETPSFKMLSGAGRNLHFGEGGNVFFGDCDEDEEDCSVEIKIKKLMKMHSGDSVIDIEGLNFQALDCGDAEHCEIQVVCEDGDCTCTVDGSDIECESIGHE